MVNIFSSSVVGVIKDQNSSYSIVGHCISFETWAKDDHLRQWYIDFLIKAQKHDSGKKNKKKVNRKETEVELGKQGLMRILPLGIDRQCA
jgi:beta-lactamase class D